LKTNSTGVPFLPLWLVFVFLISVLYHIFLVTVVGGLLSHASRKYEHDVILGDLPFSDICLTTVLCDLLLTIAGRNASTLITGALKRSIIAGLLRDRISGIVCRDTQTIVSSTSIAVSVISMQD